MVKNFQQWSAAPPPAPAGFFAPWKRRTRPVMNVLVPLAGNYGVPGSSLVMSDEANGVSNDYFPKLLLLLDATEQLISHQLDCLVHGLK